MDALITILNQLSDHPAWSTVLATVLAASGWCSRHWRLITRVSRLLVPLGRLLILIGSLGQEASTRSASVPAPIKAESQPPQPEATQGDAKCP